ncbi:MAG: hypothetical protein ACLT16_12395 [[Clostridium] innocuum]
MTSNPVVSISFSMVRKSTGTVTIKANEILPQHQDGLMEFAEHAIFSHMIIAHWIILPAEKSILNTAIRKPNFM